MFTELARVRQYFQKIKKLEEPPAERTQAVDTQAAIRFIKADLVSHITHSPSPFFFFSPGRFLTKVQADNQDINTKLKEQLAKERAKAALRASKEKGQKRSAEDAAAESSKANSPADGSNSEEGEVQEPEKRKIKRSRNGKARSDKKDKKDKKK